MAEYLPRREAALGQGRFTLALLVDSVFSNLQHQCLTSLWPEEVVCRSQISSGRAKLKLIFDQARDLVKNNIVLKAGLLV